MVAIFSNHNIISLEIKDKNDNKSGENAFRIVFKPKLADLRVVASLQPYAFAFFVYVIAHYTDLLERFLHLWMAFDFCTHGLSISLLI